MLRTLLSLLLLFAASCPAQDLPQRLKQIADTFAEGDRFSGSILVARADTILLDESYGLAQREWDIPNTPDTKFRIGSLAKQFTAAGILLLEERGLLALDDLVSTHVPDAPAAWEKVTILNLLTHTSGIPNFTDLDGYTEWKRCPTTAEQTIARFRDLPLAFEPGTRHSYSNSGYVLLGHIIERVARQPYDVFLSASILGPSGMADSGYDFNADIIPRRAAGYVRTSGRCANAPYIDMRLPHGAGALYSTTRDMMKWHRVLFGGSLLSPESLQKMLTPAHEQYALGLAVRTVRNRTVVQHAGGIDGFSSFAAYFPATRLSLIALSNVSGPAARQLVVSLGAEIMDEENRRATPVP